MSELPVDQPARARFRDEWTRNFAVSASAGSGKTTAISERLAAMALAPAGAELLRQTAVVTFTRKAAAQIGQRARHVLLRRLAESGRTDLAPLDHLEQAFFGTIHSFCLLLAQRHGQTLGINLNPSVVPENDDALWEEFLEQDPMQFTALGAAQIDAFLRHAPLDSIFELAGELDFATARNLRQRIPAPMPLGPAEDVLAEILAATSKGKGGLALKRNQAAAARWLLRFRTERGYLPLPQPEGSAAGIKALFPRYFAPVKAWLAAAGAVLAAELALRYRAWRFERGVQTYADQIEAALAVLHDATMLERIRAEGWRVILDEAQDTDPQQFAVLAEIARPPGAPLGTWPGPGVGPRDGHFCMVGDGQQAIYGSRADIRNFQRHVQAFASGSGGELLTFDVTFRAPHRVIERLNATLPAAFSRAREHNLGLPPADGAEAPLLQVPYEPLVAGPGNGPGAVGVLPLTSPGPGKIPVEVRLAAEMRQIAAHLRSGGPASVGARTWGEICLLAPRNDWLVTARKELEAAGLKTALQMRRTRNGDNPAYAWTAGLLTALCDPDNAFEWMGVLREVFAVSDADLALAIRSEKRFHWDEPERHAGPLGAALTVLKPFVGRVDAEGEPLEQFFTDLARACGLAEKTRALDPGGSLPAELERLHAHAAESGLAGAGPRAWRDELLAALEEGRPAGKPSDDAINLLTAHSAKGLEWPVVIPIGLWRTIGKPPESGLRLLAGATGEAQVFFDSDSLPAATKEARERERLRENVRLLYVVLTRARRGLVLPWGADFAPVGPGSFLDLWGADLASVPPVKAEDFAAPTIVERSGEPIRSAGNRLTADGTIAMRVLPGRVLPHQLANQPDQPRTARHESGVDEPRPARSGGDPLDYGVWWHETMEFVPWTADAAAVDAYGGRALTLAAALGFGERAGEEWARLLAGEPWREMRSARWTRLAELAVFAPLRADAWIDGVMDLVLHDAAAGEVWIVDWKTNRRGENEDDEALLVRLAAEYAPQLRAYGSCAAGFFPGCTIRLLVFSTATGSWREVPAGGVSP